MLCGIHLRAISQEVLMNLIQVCSTIMFLRITQKLLSQAPMSQNIYIFFGNIFALLASVLWGHLLVGLTTQDLTHWGWVTHICVNKLTIIGSDNGLSPGRRQAIIWTNAVISLIRTLGTNFSEILDEIHSFSFSKMHLKMSSAKWRLFGLGLNELRGFLCYVMCLNHQLKLKIH